MKLYGVSQSWNVRKVALLAAELGLPLESVRLSFQGGDFKKPEYLAKNPNGKVPTLEDDDGFVLWESSAILRYLAGKRPERGLLGEGERGAAIVDQWLFWWTAHPEGALDRLLYQRRIKPFLKQGDPDPGIIAEADAQLARFLPILDAQLAGQGHIAGALSVADFAAAPHLETAPALGCQLDGYPNIGAWLGRMQAKPYWKTA